MKKMRWAVLAVGLVGFGGWMSARGGAPETWPTASSLALAPHRPTVVMFVYPDGVSTSADLSHLSRFVRAQDENSLVYVLFVRPADREEGSEVNQTWHQAAAMRGVVVLPDPGAAEAHRFGVDRPGEMVVYQSDGVLSYAGAVAAADTGEHGEANVAMARR